MHERVLIPAPRLGGLRQRAGRGGLLTAIIAAHALALLWLASRPPPPAIMPQTAISLIDVDGREPAAPAPAPPSSKTPEVAPPAVVMPSPMSAPAAVAPSAAVASGSTGTSGTTAGGCTLASAVGQAILADPAAMTELETLPPELRTKADAVMLWDGRWQLPAAVTPGLAQTGVSGSIRHVIEQIVRDAEPGCREAVAVGPRFIPVQGATRTTVMVIGSGTWRWADLLNPDAVCPAGTSGEMCRSNMQTVISTPSAQGEEPPR